VVTSRLGLGASPLDAEVPKKVTFKFLHLSAPRNTIGCCEASAAGGYCFESNSLKEGCLQRKRGNPKWGTGVFQPSKVEPSSFEQAVKTLKLRPEEYTSSPELKKWVHKNKDHKYVPLELLAAWGFEPKSEV